MCLLELTLYAFSFKSFQLGSYFCNKLKYCPFMLENEHCEIVKEENGIKINYSRLLE